MIFASVFLSELLRTANVKILCDITLGRWFKIGSSCLKVKNARSVCHGANLTQ